MIEHSNTTTRLVVPFLPRSPRDHDHVALLPPKCWEAGPKDHLHKPHGISLHFRGTKPRIEPVLSCSSLVMLGKLHWEMAELSGTH